MSTYTETWGNTADVVCTDTEILAEGEVHQFKPGEFLSVVLNKAVKLDLRFNPRNKLYIGNKGGLEFTSNGPKEIRTYETKR